MMKWHRIYAIVLRNIYFFRRSYDRLTDAFYWPTIDLLIWGLTSSYLKSFTPGNNTIVIIIITGILFWLIVWRAQYEITVNTLEELWNKNLINLFVSPLKLTELISSFIIIGIIKGFVSLAFAAGVAFLLYKVHIFLYGFYLLPFMAILIMTGWWIGFLVMGIILRYGTKIQTLAWSMIAVISPFSAIYYPLSILPHWAQYIGYFVPTMYVFEGAREILHTGHMDSQKFVIGFALNIIYLALSFVYLQKSFKKILEKGLVKVY